MLHAGAVAQQQDWRQEARRAERAARAAPSALALAHAQLAALGDPGESVAPPREYVWAPGRIGKLAPPSGRPVPVCAAARGLLGAC